MGAGRGVTSSSRENSFDRKPRHREGHGPKTGQKKKKKKKDEKKDEEKKKKKKRKKKKKAAQLFSEVATP
jgi:hypothetical protein